MTDAEVDAMAANITRNLAALNQFCRDCTTLGEIAARYPAGTRLGNAALLAYRVFMDKARGVEADLDPTDATEPAP